MASLRFQILIGVILVSFFKVHKCEQEDLEIVVRIERIDDLKVVRGNMTKLTVRNRNVFPENIQTLPSGLFQGFPYLQRLTLDFEDLRTIETGAFMYLEHLRELILTVEKNSNSLRNGIKTFQNGILSGLTSLKNLDASWIQLQCIEGNVFYAVRNSLQTLDLSYNNLGNKNATCNLVERFSSLQHLQYLGLVGNNIQVLKLGMFADMTELRHLDISDNPISLIQPRVFLDLTSLSTLEIRQKDNPTTDDKLLYHLSPETLKGLELIKTLKLKNRGIRTLDNNTFDGLLSLKVLDLSQNEITVLEDGVFNGLTQLDVLILEQNMIQNIAEDVFLPSPHIRMLKMKGNQLGGPSPISFAYTTKLRILDLRNNDIVSIPPFVSTSRILLLGLGGNGLDCGCGINWILQSVNFGNISLISAEQTLCSTPAERAGRQITDFFDQNKECPSLVNENINISHNATRSADDNNCTSPNDISITTEQTLKNSSKRTALPTDQVTTVTVANVTSNQEINIQSVLKVHYDLLIPLIVVGCISVVLIGGVVMVFAWRRNHQKNKAREKPKAEFRTDDIRYYSRSDANITGPNTGQNITGPNITGHHITGPNITDMVYDDTLADGAYIIPIASSPEMQVKSQPVDDGYMTPVSTLNKTLLNAQDAGGYITPVAPSGVANVKAKRELPKVSANVRPRVPARKPGWNSFHVTPLTSKINDLQLRQQKEDRDDDYDVIYSEIADQDLDENKYLTVIA